MIRKIWNSLLRGDAKTKAYLWSLLGLSVAVTALAVAGICTGNAAFFVPAVLLAIIEYVIFKSISFMNIVDSTDAAADDMNGEEIAGRTREGIKDKDIKERGIKDRVGRERDGREKDRADDEKTDKDAEDDKEAEDSEEEREDYLDDYTEKALKAYFHKYKVSKEHFPILIDNSKKHKITQCPAYIWKDKHSVNLFLLEETPRKISIPAHEVTTMFYLKGATAYPEREYEKVRNSAVMKLAFQGLLPAYYEEGANGKYVNRKNLYGFAEDILITAASAKAIMEYMQLRFEMSSMYIGTGNYSDFFIEATKLKTLWKDGVLDAGAYKKKIRAILTKLALADYTVSEYLLELERMVHKQLITDEYAKYYKEHRQEIRKKGGK